MEVKSAGPRSGNTAGSTVEYRFVVANTGNATLAKVTVTDVKIPTVTCPLSTLAPGESMACTGTYVLTAADVAAGKVLNSASASGILLACVVTGDSIRALDVCDPGTATAQHRVADQPTGSCGSAAAARSRCGDAVGVASAQPSLM